MSFTLTVIAQAVAFALFIWFTVKFVWPPMLRAIEARRQWKPPEQRATKVLVWRHDARVFYRALEKAEARAVEAASGGVAFAKMCEIVAADSGARDAVAEMNRLLARWLSDGLLMLAPHRARKLNP